MSEQDPRLQVGATYTNGMGKRRKLEAVRAATHWNEPEVCWSDQRTQRWVSVSGWFRWLVQGARGTRGSWSTGYSPRPAAHWTVEVDDD